MAKQTVGIGSTANDGTGDDLRTGGDKINDNFNELYTALGDGSTLGLTAAITSAGALMDSEVTNLAAVKAFDPTDYATAAQGSAADSAIQPDEDAAILGSGAATDGHVLTADGAGGAAWEAPPGGAGGDAWSDAVDADIVPDADGTRDLGSATNRFASLHVDSIDLNGTTFTGTTLADPGADALLGWDDVAGETAFFSAAETRTLLNVADGAEANTIESDPTGITGADQVTNVMSLTTAEYGAITPNASTLYLITDAS